MDRAFGVTAQPYSRDAVRYIIGPTGTDGTLTFVAYPDDGRTHFDGIQDRASAVVECLNRVGMFYQSRTVAGRVVDLPQSLSS